jgi:diguanylate cyclase (GGDEF)-like protein
MLLVTMALSIVMLLVLSSLSNSDARGIREWLAANALAVVALPLFAARGVLPDLLTIELANTLLMGTSATMLAGFQRHLGRRVPALALLGAIGLGLAAIVVFHHVIDSFILRVVAMSTVHAALCLAMGLTVARALPAAPRRYPWLFTAGAAYVVAAGQAVRACVYGAQAAGWIAPIDESVLSTVFFALGTLSLPGLTLGAVMMTNAGLIARATYAADHDHLTGACSRRAFFDVAARELARAQRRGMPLSLLLFDADHFKRINDTFGHAIGDRVLIEIVQHTRGLIRSMDTCARLGGEEFAVLLPETGADTALVVAQRLRAGLARALDDAPGSMAVAYTVSIGVATLTPEETVAGLLSRADLALYAAKSGGRNTVAEAQEVFA